MQTEKWEASGRAALQQDRQGASVKEFHLVGKQSSPSIESSRAAADDSRNVLHVERPEGGGGKETQARLRGKASFQQRRYT